MDSRREVILAFLKTHGPATLAEIAAHLEVSKQGALRHLEVLEGSGLATVATADTHRRGRPENVYKLTAAAGDHFPDGHRELTGQLVDFMTNEQQMYERLLGTDVARTTWMAEANDDCTYVMKEKEKQIG